MKKTIIGIIAVACAVAAHADWTLNSGKTNMTDENGAVVPVSVNSANEITINRYTSFGSSGMLDFSTPILDANGNDGYSIVAIGKSAFESVGALTGIKLPESTVRSIGQYAFYACGNLATFSPCLPDSVTWIGDGCFTSCSKLAVDVRIMSESPVTYQVSGSGYAYGDFKSAGIKSLTLGPGSTTCGGGMLESANSITNVTVSDNFSYFSNWAFYQNAAIREVVMGTNVPAWHANQTIDSKKTRFVVPAWSAAWHSVITNSAMVGEVSDMGTYRSRFGENAPPPVGMTKNEATYHMPANQYIVVRFSGDTQLSVTAGDNALEETASPGSFIVSRSGGDGNLYPMNVFYTSSGTAMADREYYLLSGVVTIPAGQDSATIEVRPKACIDVDEDRQLTLTLSADPNYTIATASASITIVNGEVSSEKWQINSGKTQMTEIVAGGQPWVLNVSVSSTNVTVSGIAAVGDNTELDFDGVIKDNSDVRYVVTTFNKDVFTSHNTITRLILPKALKSLNWAFWKCAGIANAIKIGCYGLPVSLPEGWQFEGCSHIPEIELGSGVTSIPQNFANGCSSLTNLVFSGNDDVSISGDYAFGYCSSLKDITCRSFVNFWSQPYTLYGSPAGRLRYLKTNTKWLAKIQDLKDAGEFSSWESLNAEERQPYYNMFGANAETPIGRAKIGNSAPVRWLVPFSEEVEEVKLAVTGTPVEYGTVTPNYCGATTVTPPVVMSTPDTVPLNGILYGVTGYTLQKYVDDTWQDVANGIGGHYTFNETASGNYQMTWGWAPVGYRVTIATNELTETYGSVTAVAPKTNGYWCAGHDIAITATPKNGARFVRWFGNVANEDIEKAEISVASDAVKTLIPYFEGPWTYNSSNQTITDGYWKFNVTGTADALTVSSLNTRSAPMTLLDFRKEKIGFAITAIGAGLFNDKDGYVTELRLPDTLTSIGTSAFRYCYSLHKVEPQLPDAVTYIGPQAFSWTDLHGTLRIGFNKGTLAMPRYEVSKGDTFKHNTHITQIEFGRAVTSIPGFAFNECSSVTNIIFRGRDEVTVTGEETFEYCFPLKEMTCYAFVDFWATEWTIYGATTGRILYLSSNPKWQAKMQALRDAGKISTWELMNPTQRQEYYNAYGADAKKPIGRATIGSSGRYAASNWWLVPFSDRGLTIIIR